jgi:hypothetical protein
MLGIMAMARQTRDRNERARHFPNRVKGTVHKKGNTNTNDDWSNTIP